MENNNRFRTVRGYQILQKNKKLLTSAMEDYLEMIYRNSFNKDYLRINELAELLNVRASSTSKMVQKLAMLGMVKYKKYGIIILTEAGRALGEYLLDRHKTVEDFLRLLNFEGNILVATELIEHSIDANLLKSLKMLNDFFEYNKDIFQKFNEFRLNY